MTDLVLWKSYDRVLFTFLKEDNPTYTDILERAMLEIRAQFMPKDDKRDIAVDADRLKLCITSCSTPRVLYVAVGIYRKVVETDGIELLDGPGQTRTIPWSEACDLIYTEHDLKYVGLNLLTNKLVYEIN